MGKENLIEKIISKKEFSDLPKKDVEAVFDKFDNEKYTDEEKVKLSRDLLRKMYTAFLSNKLLKLKENNPEWFLKKHLSTKERLPYYKEVYSKILFGLSKKMNIFDLGCGVNGFSYKFFKESGYYVNYVGVEAVGQIVEIQNEFFKKNKFSGAFFKASLFDSDEIKNIIKNSSGVKVIFLFKALDSLEMLRRDFSKKLLKDIVPLADRVVVSFATRSLGSHKKFYAKRDWIKEFISKNFEVLKEEEIGGEFYIVFSKKTL